MKNTSIAKLTVFLPLFALPRMSETIELATLDHGPISLLAIERNAPAEARDTEALIQPGGREIEVCFPSFQCFRLFLALTS
jgi:hypothetical protein